MDGDKLKPCPFCGRTAELVKDGNSYCVMCTGLYCCGKNGWYLDQRDAVRAWNRRAGNADRYR